MAGTWDVVFGIDQTTINNVIADMLRVAPSLFNPTIPANGPGFTAVQLIVQAPPTLNLEPSTGYLDLARAHAAELGYTGDVEVAAAAMAGGSGTLTFQQVEFVLLNQNQSIGAAAGEMLCNIAFFSDGQSFWANISDMRAWVPNNPEMNMMIIEYVGDAVLSYFANNVFDPLKLPINLPFGNFAIPAINTEVGGPVPELVAYSGLQPVTLPTELVAWPADAAFLALDSAVLTAVATHYMPNPTGSGGISDPNFSWDYSVGLTPTVQVQPGGGQLNIPLGIGGSASITYHTPNGLPNITIGASISGSATMEAIITAQQTANNGMELDLMIGGLGGYDLHLDMGGVPGIISGLINDIISPILDDVAGAVTSFLQGKTFTLDSFPAATIPFSSGPVSLFLAPVQVQTVPGPDGVPVLILFGQVQVLPG